MSIDWIRFFTELTFQGSGYNTLNGCMPQIGKPRTEWGRNVLQSNNRLDLDAERA